MESQVRTSSSVPGGGGGGFVSKDGDGDWMGLLRKGCAELEENREEEVGSEGDGKGKLVKKLTRVSICPVMQLFVDPGPQRDGAVCEGVAQSLWLGGLLGAVAGALVLEPVAASKAGALALVVRSEGVLGVEQWVREQARTGAMVHVEVRGEAVVREEEGDRPGDVVCGVSGWDMIEASRRMKSRCRMWDELRGASRCLMTPSAACAGPYLRL